MVLEKEIFKGNLLDIGLENHGIIYNAYKQLNAEISVDYVEGKESENIKEGHYDSCVLLFSISKISYRKNKLRLFEEINGFLKENGALYIWDIDKGKNKIWNSKIKIETPDNRVKEITIKENNFFKDCSKEGVLKLLNRYFEVIDFNCKDGVYYIKANKIKREGKK